LGYVDVYCEPLHKLQINQIGVEEIVKVLRPI
jgi:hypothetical protein